MDAAPVPLRRARRRELRELLALDGPRRPLTGSSWRGRCDEHAARRSPTAPPPLAARLRDVASSPVREILALTQRPGVISFAGGLPAPELFDAPGLRAAFAAALDDEAFGRTLQYSTTEGDPALRGAIAARMAARGLPTEADDVLITSGSQQALTLIAAVLLEPGDAVLVEEPSYLAALQCFQMAGARVVPVPCDDDGLDPEALAALVRRERPKLLYTVPTFHNPTGRTLPLERRAALAQAAARLGLWIVEDDPYGELRYRGEPIAPVASLAGARGPDDRAVDVVEGVGPGPADRLAAGARGAAPRAGRRQAGRRPAHVHDRPGRGRALARRVRPRRARRRAARRLRRRAATRSSTACRTTLPEGSRWTRPDGGMFVWVRLPDGWDADALLQARAGARGRVRPRLAVLPGAAGSRDAAPVVHHPHRGRDRRGPGPPAAPPWTAAAGAVTLQRAGDGARWRGSPRPTRTWGARCRCRASCCRWRAGSRSRAVGPQRRRGRPGTSTTRAPTSPAASRCTPAPSRRPTRELTDATAPAAVADGVPTARRRSSEAQPSLRPVHELRWQRDGLHLRLTAQGPWAVRALVAIAQSVA